VATRSVRAASKERAGSQHPATEGGTTSTSRRRTGTSRSGGHFLQASRHITPAQTVVRAGSEIRVHQSSTTSREVAGGRGGGEGGGGYIHSPVIHLHDAGIYTVTARLSSRQRRFVGMSEHLALLSRTRAALFQGRASG
jgi:hypothetical protein